jgi:hypothetical protein
LRIPSLMLGEKLTTRLLQILRERLGQSYSVQTTPVWSGTLKERPTIAAARFRNPLLVARAAAA